MSMISLSSVILSAPQANGAIAENVIEPLKYTFSNLWRYGVMGVVRSEGRLHILWLFTAIIFCAALGYFLGSVNSAVLISKTFYKDDVRNHGSGNAGATNMSRTFGKKAGIITLICDLMKAIVTVTIARLLCGEVFAYLGAMFCALGHAFPCYYKFKGGKCVAVTAAAVLMLEPIAFLLSFVIFAGIVAMTKYVSLGSIAAAFFLPLMIYNIQNMKYGMCDERIIFIVLTCALVVILHKDNISRLREGKEKKFSFGGKSKGKTDP